MLSQRRNAKSRVTCIMRLVFGVGYPLAATSSDGPNQAFSGQIRHDRRGSL